MKRILKACCGFLLILSLAACGSNGESQPTDPAPAINNEQITSFSSAESSVQTEQAPTESSEHTLSSSIESSESIEENSVGNDIADRLIQITTREGGEIVFQLNESPLASSFYNQLPLSVWIEDYAGSEKIFYPPDKLDTNDAPLARGPAGTLAYYAPWGNVAIFYGECGGASGLYELGNAVTGAEFIRTMTGEVEIEAVGASPASAGSVEAEIASVPQPPPASRENPDPQEPVNAMRFEENGTMKINLQMGDHMFTATLEENPAADSFAGLLKNAPLSMQMRDYAGFEKVGSLGTTLPASDSQTTTQSGDIVLYNGNQIVIFYGSNSWSYTRLGRIDDLTGWEAALGNGDLTVTFSVG